MIKFPWTKTREHLLEIDKELTRINERATFQIEDLQKEIEDLKQRLGKAEIMHAATSKKQNELFDNAMNKMIDTFGKFGIHMANLAEKRVKEVTEHIGALESGERPTLLLVNGKLESIQGKEVTHDELIILALGFLPQGDENCTVTYRDGADEEKPFGTMDKEDILLVGPETSVNVVMISADGG